ncbi:uncharacterized protein Z520_10353 [Fonsecaea multimorphosa CBS 102226]|uniref:Uncharacterized protein n=1 Tax=Fonsecaea multimorphosa CBS 102226 TaxID=1442371 RepID=A0A0D2IA38_9EURO|nr:uncharacterized protein Z520_10353 [Fonsecaea multimorphosa CBS 102226]KIX94016.1 hypothetical protein Z520_10353 [Fonsecaea multimorphosa CBS 102226]OAL19363.1 hypothetical protein AYO22_09907 [Fonsecaea multimorphosa]
MADEFSKVASQSQAGIQSLSDQTSLLDLSARQSAQPSAPQPTDEREEEEEEAQHEDDNGKPFPGAQTERDLAHHRLFGRQGFLRSTRTTKHSWAKAEPFVKQYHLPWNVPLSPESLGKLIHGFAPVEMEDKWFIYADGPDASGAATVNFHRSWTGAKVAEIALDIAWGEDSAAGLWSGSIVQLTLESDIDGLPEEDSAEELVKFQVLEACHWVLGIKLVDEIKEPKSWEALSKMPALSRRLSTSQITYRGTRVSQETMEDLERLRFQNVQILLS